MLLILWYGWQYEDAGISPICTWWILDGARNQKRHNIKCWSASAIIQIPYWFWRWYSTEDDLRVVFESGAAQGNVGSLAGKAGGIRVLAIKVWNRPAHFAADVKRYDVGCTCVKDYQYDTPLRIDWPFLSSGLQIHLLVPISQRMVCYKVLIWNCTEHLQPDILIWTSLQVGVHHVDDLHQLESVHCHGVIIVGKAIYEHKIQIKDLVSFQIN